MGSLGKDDGGCQQKTLSREIGERSLSQWLLQYSEMLAFRKLCVELVTLQTIDKKQAHVTEIKFPFNYNLYKIHMS